MDQFNEKSTGYVTVTLLDKTGAQAAPASSRYRIDDLASGTEILTWTAGAAAASQEITLTTAHNTLVNVDGKDEIHALTFEATYSATDLAIAEYQHEIKALRFYP